APRTSYEERVASMNERGWDVQDGTSQESHEGDLQVFPLPATGASRESNRSGEARTFPPARPAVPVDAPNDTRSAAAEPGPELSPDERRRRLDAIAEQIRSCRGCPLSMGRTNAVPGEGALDAMVMIVGEGPGYHEDQQGRPFVGKAGLYLDKWLEAIGITREESAFIANIVKCRPPNNRDPKPEESDVCSPYLRRQISLIRPRLIVTVGRISTRILTGSTQGITRIHGTFFRYEGIPLVPTFHPSAVLRNPAYRRPVWEDLKKVRNWLIDNAGHQPQGSAE
ncbi:MAG: uracil-DNA glycosylase, partial [Alkalispirochaeta sp.]